MAQPTDRPRFYDGDGDELMVKEHEDLEDRLVLVPDAFPSKTPDATPRIRLMWGQHLLEDLLASRYRCLVCGVNAQDNSRGIIAQLAAMLPTSQWDERSVTAYAQQFAAAAGQRVKVIKYDMDVIEVLGILRPPGREHLTLEDLGLAFRIIAQMVQRNPHRVPTASVSFLGARANRLLDASGREPSFESVLRTMYEAGFTGDVYPSPAMWRLRMGLFCRYPFPPALEQIRHGGG